MSLKVLILVLMVAVCRAASKKILCQMVSLETDGGMSGYCCVIFRNSSEFKNEEEIKRHIIDSFKNATVGEVSEKSNTTDVVTFPSEEENKIKFPDEIDSEDLNTASFDDRKEPVVSENEKNDTVTVIPVNRNVVDVPGTCPQGSMKDYNGNCVPVC